MLNLSDSPKILAQRLNAILESRGLSKYELSQMTNVPYPTIKRITRMNAKACPNVETIYLIAHELNLSVDYLIGASDIKSSTKLDEEFKSLYPEFAIATQEDKEAIKMILRKYSASL
jgi:transcriptional regulator with XRE-family HTH domain